MIRIALTIGDINGIGPEVILKSLRKLDALPGVQILPLGPLAAFQAWAELLKWPDWPFAVRDVQKGLPPAAEGILFLDNHLPCDRVLADMGRPTEASGLVAGKTLEMATRLALEKKIDALVTAPLAKTALHAAGYPYPGHTEFLAQMTGVEKPVMMLVAGTFRVALLTTHLPLKAVPAALTVGEVLRTVHTLVRDLRSRFGITSPRIAVAGLNPHAGESGEFGREEIEVLQPALRELAAAGVDVTGPVPADALFSRGRAREAYDVYLAMYHDQGLIPVKVIGRGRAVNYTCGLPFVRTSPDHGTAFDITGKNVADEGSFLEAVHFAIERVRNGKTG